MAFAWCWHVGTNLIIRKHMFLSVPIIRHPVHHILFADGFDMFQKAACRDILSVVNMGYNAKIAYIFHCKIQVGKND